MSAFDLEAPAWTFHEPTGQWYLHLFEPAQPDLDWDEPAVEAAMHDTLRFWLDRGVDGFRADVIHGIGKDPGLPDDPPEMAGIPHCALNDVPVTHERLRRIRTLLDGYPGERMMVGEVFLLSTEAVATYYGHDDELHLAFNFPPLFAPWLADRWAGLHRGCPSCAGPPGRLADLGPVEPRQPPPPHPLRPGRGPGRRGPGDDGPAQRAAGPGPPPCCCSPCGERPFVYQGDELGLTDADIPEDRRVDPGGATAAGPRSPGTAVADHGWPTVDGATTWLPFPPDADHPEPGGAGRGPRVDPPPLPARPVAVRRATPALVLGRTSSRCGSPAGTLAYRRVLDGDRRARSS